MSDFSYACAGCNGSGFTTYGYCPDCNGTGRREVINGRAGPPLDYFGCSSCSGTGRNSYGYCPDCAGTGRISTR